MASDTKSKTRPKLGLVYSSQESPWGSCNSISAYLRAAYESLSASCDLYHLPFSESHSAFDIFLGNGYFMDQAQAILKNKITKLCVLDHRINLIPLISALKLLSPTQAKKIQYVIHVYGDFTLFSDFWLELGNELKDLSVTLFCASERQADLVHSFEQTSKNNSAVHVCPFPVDTDYFCFSHSARTTWREKLKLQQKEHLCIYTGRLSLSKGIITTVQEFAHQCSHNPNVTLALAGLYDDIGSPTTDIMLNNGYFYHRLQETVRALPQSVQKRILFLGSLGKEDLLGLYSAADSFISLSLYHDEDFGMSPAEALSTGLPCLLTDWGGYSSFQTPGVKISYVPVALNDRGLSIDHSVLRENWGNLLQKESFEKEIRAKRAAAFRKKFAIPTIANLIQEQLHKKVSPFSGLSWQLAALKNPNNLQNGLYKKVYQNYVSADSERTMP